jgi:hypothetical protein
MSRGLGYAVPFEPRLARAAGGANRKRNAMGESAAAWFRTPGSRRQSEADDRPSSPGGLAPKTIMDPVGSGFGSVLTAPFFGSAFGAYKIPPVGQGLCLSSRQRAIVEVLRERLWQGICHRLRRETIVKVKGKFRRILCEVTGWEGDCTEDQSSLREPVNS